MTGCPHKDIRFCPLYVAAHDRCGLGCDDGQLGEGQCAISRGLVYARQIELIRVKCPGMVERLEWNEDREKTQEQRVRRVNGIH
jgi:DNA-binding IclR family transcriptional regulator